MAKRNFPITRKEFSTYIRKRGVTFESNDTANCPIAKAVQAKTGNDAARIGSYEYYPNGFDGESEPLPGWAKRFVAKFDETKGTVADAKRIQPKIV